MQWPIPCCISIQDCNLSWVHGQWLIQLKNSFLQLAEALVRPQDDLQGAGEDDDDGQKSSRRNFGQERNEIQFTQNIPGT